MSPISGDELICLHSKPFREFDIFCPGRGEWGFTSV